MSEITTKDFLQVIDNLPLSQLYKINNYIVGVIRYKISEQNLKICEKFPVGSCASFISSKTHRLHHILITNITLRQATGREFCSEEDQKRFEFPSRWRPTQWTVTVSLLQECKETLPTETMPPFNKMKLVKQRRRHRR